MFEGTPLTSQDTRNMCDVDAKENRGRKCSCEGHKLGQLSSKNRAALLNSWLRPLIKCIIKLSQNSYTEVRTKSFVSPYIYIYASKLQIRGGVGRLIFKHIVVINIMFNMQIQGGVGTTPESIKSNP